MLVRQLQLFLIAIGFFTRIPIPASITIDAERLNQASRYFAAVGIVVGLISAFTYLLLAQWLPASIAIVAAMVMSVIATGGFHEDGLADTADGFGGGWTVDDKLAIMKDSRLGTYGALALVLALLAKFVLLTEVALIDDYFVAVALVVGHCLSRMLAASMIFSATYVRDTQSKSKPLASSQTANELGILLATGAAVLWLSPLEHYLSLIVCLGLTRFILLWGFKRQIGGYTGDTLGAAQQVSELVIYLFILVVLA
ncbi:adenosylcobinamide-GDP ribazoletransferase [Shewanella waksmanii]|uniref:adenosylcobinamide-GDP ribazoletransferase n=1 Tax=Shewanella waksmanii TaxID=213783 RepID=UPI00048FE3EB|nr:adenosylcobinamide-GDP ribazoletransferase [Shewanella waksmanii]